MKRVFQNVSTCNNFLEELEDDPEKIYDYIPNANDDVIQSALINLSSMSVRGYKLLDFLFVTGYSFDDKDSFFQELIDKELLISYIKSVEKRDNKFLKAMMYTYLEPVEFKEMYEDLTNVIHDLSYEGEYRIENRVNALLDFANQYSYKDNRIPSLVKKTIISIVRDDPSFNASRTKEEVNDYINNAISTLNKKLFYMIKF